MSASNEATPESLVTPPPRWRRKRYWFVGTAILALLVMWPLYRRHQLIQQQFGDYGKPPEQRKEAVGWSFDLAPRAWPLKYVSGNWITPFDRLTTAQLHVKSTSDLQLFENEVDLKGLFFEVMEDVWEHAIPLDALRNMKKLNRVHIEGLSVPGDGLKALHELPALRELHLGLRAPVVGLQTLRGHPTIERLELIKYCRLPFNESDKPLLDSASATEVLHAIAEMPELQTLHWDIGSPTSFAALTAHPRLRILNASTKTIRFDDFHAFAQIKSLAILSITTHNIERGALNGLEGTQVRHLEVRCMSRSTSRASPHELLAGIRPIPSVTHFDGLFSLEDDAEVALIVNCFPNLVTLSLGDTSPESERSSQGVRIIDPDKNPRGKVTDGAVESIANLTRLSALDLGRNEITDAAVETLGRIQSLKRLDVSKTRISAHGVARLKKLLPTTKFEPLYVPMNCTPSS